MMYVDGYGEQITREEAAYRVNIRFSPSRSLTVALHDVKVSVGY